MKKELLAFGSLLFGVALLSSCSKDDSSESGKLSYKVEAKNHVASLGSSASVNGLEVGVNSNSTLTWTFGTLNINEIDFEAKSSETDVEIELKNQFNVDLLNLGPVLGSIQLPEGSYEKVELKIELEPSATKVPLTLKGSYTNSAGHNIPVEFYFNEEFEVKVEAKDITVSGSEDYIAMINLELNKFLSNVSSADLDQASQTNGVIVVAGDSNTSLYNKFKSNLNILAKCEFED